MKRRDWYFGRLHVIRRHYERPQYGWLAWRGGYRGPWTLDVWFHCTLWTFRIYRRYA